MSNKYKLKGHGSFGVREGWLNKGLKCINDNPLIFRDKKAADMLGVGANMAQAIRYWLKAFNLMSESTAKGAELSPLGKIIIKEDPYFEDILTLWILHYNLVSNEDVATTWYLFFNKCDAEEYTRDEILVQLKNQLIIKLNDDSFPEASLRDDLLVLTNMYAKSKVEGADPEENMISPFVQLGLLSEKKHKYSRTIPEFGKLPDEAVLYGIVKRMKESNYATSISIDNLLDSPNSIGKVFNLSRVALNYYLDRLETKGYIRVNRTAGLDIVYLEDGITSNGIVQSYYTNTKG